jgi:hypothetical protein
MNMKEFSFRGKDKDFVEWLWNKGWNGRMRTDGKKTEFFNKENKVFVVTKYIVKYGATKIYTF